MTKLSAHFTLAEFKCKGKEPCQTIPPPPKLLLVLEDIRYHAGGRPLPIKSGYRCERHNDAVGGAFASQHLLGTAADIPPGFVDEAGARRAGATGIGLSGQWVVHVDVRPGAVMVWRY